MAKIKWTIENLQKEALRYSTKAEFQKSSKGAYLSAYRRGLLDTICSHMVSMRTTWDEENVAKEASKYNTKAEFALKSSGAYHWALNNNILENVTSHMTDPRIKWDYDSVLKEASKYTTRNAFKKGNTGAYGAAIKLGVMDSICQHMKQVNKVYTDQELELLAKNYSYREEFRRCDYGAYQAAYRRGLLDAICTHMEYQKGAFKFNEPAYLYYVKISTKDGSLPDIYKIGVTGRPYILDRFYKDYLVTTTEIEVLYKTKFENGIEAFNKEQEIKTLYKESIYTGQSPLVNTKTTEMFIEDIFKGNYNEINTTGKQQTREGYAYV